MQRLPRQQDVLSIGFSFRLEASIEQPYFRRSFPPVEVDFHMFSYVFIPEMLIPLIS